MTFPYSPKIAGLITGSLRHELTVNAVTVTGLRYPLDVEEGSVSVTFAEDWSPYAQASLSAALPSEFVLDDLDPRENVRVELEAGYTFPDNVSEVFAFADLAARTRSVKRPANTVELSAASDEARAQDRRMLWQTNIPRTGINECVAWLISYSVEPESPLLISAFPNGSFAAELAELEVDALSDMWAVLDELAARTGTRIYCDEHRIWRIVVRPELAAEPAHELVVGEAGTIMDSEAGLDREEWYNAVAIRHRWSTPAGEQTVYGIAQIVAGPTSVLTVGRRVYAEESTFPISQAQADAKAATRLRNLASRGRSLKLSAIAAYWLRPGMTVRVTLPTGEPELHLIQAITFLPLVGRMELTTRQPFNVTISTGE